jgi:hypothetical protein
MLLSVSLAYLQALQCTRYLGVLPVQFSIFLYTGWPVQAPNMINTFHVRAGSPTTWHAMQLVTSRSIQVVCTWALCLHLFAVAMASMAGPAAGPPGTPAPVRRFVCVHCSATGHLSSRGLFLHRSAVLRHIRGSKPCFAADLGFKEIHVEARPGDVMAGAGGAAGPAPDVRHQPPGEEIDIYNDSGSYCISASRTVVKAGGLCLRGPGFEFPLRQLFAGLEYVHRSINLYITCMYFVYT